MSRLIPRLRSLSVLWCFILFIQFEMMEIGKVLRAACNTLHLPQTLRGTNLHLVIADPMGFSVGPDVFDFFQLELLDEIDRKGELDSAGVNDCFAYNLPALLFRWQELILPVPYFDRYRERAPSPFPPSRGKYRLTRLGSQFEIRPPLFEA